LRALARTGNEPGGRVLHRPFGCPAEARTPASRFVAAAIASLDPDQRDVVLMITWAELTYDQAAEALGVPEGTVQVPDEPGPGLGCGPRWAAVDPTSIS